MCSDIEMPFTRWDADRIALWLHVIGLSGYVGNCKRWGRNGEQLLQASTNELEKVSLIVSFLIVFYVCILT